MNANGGYTWNDLQPHRQKEIMLAVITVVLLVITVLSGCITAAVAGVSELTFFVKAFLNSSGIISFLMAIGGHALAGITTFSCIFFLIAFLLYLLQRLVLSKRDPDYHNQYQ